MQARGQGSTVRKRGNTQKSFAEVGRRARKTSELQRETVNYGPVDGGKLAGGDKPGAKDSYERVGSADRQCLLLHQKKR